MNYEALKFWIDLAQFVLMFGMTIMFHRSNKKQVEKTEIQELENRLARMETDAKHAPTHEDLAKIYKEINTTNSLVQEMRGESRASKHTLDLIHQHLMSRSD